MVWDVFLELDDVLDSKHQCAKVGNAKLSKNNEKLG